MRAQNKSWRTPQLSLLAFLSLYTLKQHRIKCLLYQAEGTERVYYSLLSWALGSSKYVMCYCWWCLRAHWLVMLQPQCPMTIRLSPSMDKEGYCFLGPFTTPEAPLRYFSEMCFWVLSIWPFYQMGYLKVSSFFCIPKLRFIGCCCFRCGQILSKRLRKEVWMWFKLMFSGMGTNLHLAK